MLVSIPACLRHAPILLLGAGLALLVGCGDDKSVAPRSDAPPIEISSDASSSPSGGFTLRTVSVDGRTLRLGVAYSGGCKTHTFAAIAPPSFLESYPAQLPVYIRLEGEADPCLAIVSEDLEFDVTPAVELHQASYGTPTPFYLRIITPGVTEPTLVLVR